MKIRNRLEMDSIIGGKNIRKKIGAFKRKTVPFLVATLLVTTALCYGGPQSDCPSYIVGYWNMDESSGALVPDSYGGNHGEVLSDGDGDDPVWMTGIVGNALHFTGDADDKVIIGDDLAYHFGTGDFALEAWIKYEGPIDGTVMYPAIMSKRPGPNPSEGFGLYLSYYPGDTAGSVLIRIEDTNYHQSTIPVDDGGWHHVVVQRCQGQVQIYVDGQLNVTAPSDKNATTEANLTLGLDPSSGYDTEWEGLIDEVALYCCCLSPETINCHYECGLNHEGYCSCECEQPCQWTSCGIINEVATNPANWTSNWTGTTITPETTITFQECNGDVYTLYGLPDMHDNDFTTTLQNYGDCQYAKYCWIEVNNKKIIEEWEIVPSNDPDCQNCCEHCCEIDFTFIGSPVDGSGGSDPPCRCPGQILTYEYRLTNGGPYEVNCDFSNTSPVGNVTFDPSAFSVDPGGTQIIYIHYQMPGEYGDTCTQQSYTFSHVLNVTVIIGPEDDVVECTPIERSVHIDCYECPQIGCCDSVSNLFSGEHMQMRNTSGNWVQINTIPWDSWDVPFGNLDDQLHNNCGAKWVYGIGDWNSPSSSEEHYKLDFTIPQGECYEIAFSTCVDDAAIFSLKAPNGETTEFFNTTESSSSAGTYSNFYAFFEKGDNGEMEYCLPQGDYTLYIDHWNTGGSYYGLIFAATTCNLCSCPSYSCIDIEKEVVDPTTGEFVDNIEVPVDTEILFWITVCNCGTSDLEGIKVVDYFPDWLEYSDSSANVTIDVTNISGNQVVWDFSSVTLHPEDCFNMKVYAMVIFDGDCENFIVVHAESQGESISDGDCAAVTVIGNKTADAAPEGSEESGGQCLGSTLLIGILALGAIALNRKKG